MNEFNKQQKESSDYAQWAGGMEHVGITNDYKGIQSSIDYVIAFISQSLFAKNFLDIDNELFNRSKQITAQILENWGYKEKHEYYSDMSNAFDYHFIFYPERVNEISRIDRVLDFGSGYGRQANLFTDKVSQYWATDAIENSYKTQTNYLQELAQIKKKNFFEYMKTPFDRTDTKKEKGIFHIPAWNLEKLEREYFDLIICSHILPELTEKSFELAFKQIMSLIRPGGFLYIRDHGLRWQPGHLYDADMILLENGFVPEYCIYARDKNDIHGIPRIYRKITDGITHRIPEKSLKQWNL